MKAGMRVINNPMGSRCVLLMQHTWLYNNKVHMKCNNQQHKHCRSLLINMLNKCHPSTEITYIFTTNFSQIISITNLSLMT